MESNLASAPQLDIISNRKERTGAHIGSAYVDAANQARMTEYNNEYNYWLWKQQAEYNSPLEQRRRLEAAGLNPNFNSVDSGNLGSMPTSSGSVSPSVGKNSAAAMQNNINTFNALVKSIGEGVSDVSKIAALPDDIGAYRKMIRQFMGHRTQAAEYDKILRSIETIFKGKTELGIDMPLVVEGYGPNGDPWVHTADWTNSPLFSNLGLKNEDLDWLIKLRKFDYSQMKPAELKVLQERATQIANAAGLTKQQSDVYGALVGTKIGATIAPLLLALVKMIF